MTATGFCILVIVLFFAGCDKQGSSDGAAAAAKIPDKPPVEGSSVVVAKLLEIPGEFPPNELYNYAYIMKYQVEQVVEGKPLQGEILVGHYNPRFARGEIQDDQKDMVGGNLKSFRVGDKHYLVLNSLDEVWQGAIEDEYYRDTSPRYWASWVDKL